MLGEGSAEVGEPPAVDDAEIDRRIDAALAANRRAKDIAEELSLVLHVSKKDVYDRVVRRREASRGRGRG